MFKCLQGCSDSANSLPSAWPSRLSCILPSPLCLALTAILYPTPSLLPGPPYSPVSYSLPSAWPSLVSCILCSFSCPTLLPSSASRLLFNPHKTLLAGSDESLDHSDHAGEGAPPPPQVPLPIPTTASASTPLPPPHMVKLFKHQ